MNVDWRWAAGPAAVAFILSLLTGIFVGVPFLVLLLRAILGSALFSALGTGIGFLAQRQLPELFEAPGESSGGAQPRVDITIGDEEEEEVPEPAEESEDTKEGGLTSLDAEDIESVGPKSEEAPEREAPLQAPQQDITESLVEEVEEAALPDEALSTASQFEEEETQSEELESVDELPDIGGFEGAFEDGSSGESGEGYRGEESSLSNYGSGSASRRSRPGGFDAGNDPAQIAKALQTMLKRDS
ncbi:MAG: hypothetical protein ACLFPW_08165 [Spirochaetaceae bacterium]